MKKKVVVFDTNALLDIYQYTNDTIEEIISYIDDNSSFDVYISEIVYSEFIKHYQQSRSKTGDRNPIVKFKKMVNKFEQGTINSLKDIIDLKMYKGFDTSLPDELSKLLITINRGFSSVNTEIDKIYVKEDIGFTGDDILFDFVEKTYGICNPRVLNFQEKIKQAAIAEQRIKMNLKPGLTDVKGKRGTENFREYGDIFIWFDILELANRYDEIVFLENEIKLDWWENDSYNQCAKNLQLEWNDLFSSRKLFKMFRLEDFLLTYAEDYLQTENQLEISKLKTEFIKAVQTNSMFNQNQLLDKLYDYAPEDIDHLVLGLPFMYGNVDDIRIFEMLEPQVILDNVKYDFDNVTRTIFAFAEVMVPYDVSLTISYDKDSDYKRYRGTLNITYNCEFEFHIYSKNDLDILIESIQYNSKTAKVNFDDIKH